MDEELLIEIKQKKVKELDISPQEVLQRLYRITLQGGHSFAMYRLPQQEEVSAIIDLEGYQLLNEIELDKLKSGFLFHPFDKGDKAFIRGHVTYNTSQRNPKFSNELNPNIKSDFMALLQMDKESYVKPNQDFPTSNRTNLDDTTREQYIKMVKEVLAEISEVGLQKVVPSRVKSIKLNQPFEIFENFNRLCKAYPNAFVYFTSVDGLGSWMGATPEVLIEVEDDQVFRTISMAGTQKYDKGTDLRSVAWTQKEIEEQALVSRFIINCFKKIRLREFTEKGPKTVVAGNLMHLKTIFEVDLQETDFHNLGTAMLKLLHPTSAVCGMPRENAKSLLARIEPHDRKYYSGFLGPVDGNKCTHLFVNLRCMELFHDE